MTDFHLRLKQETIDSIKELAEQESRCVSGMARKILEEYFDERGRKIKEIEKDFQNHLNVLEYRNAKISFVKDNTLTIPVIKTDKNGNI